MKICEGGDLVTTLQKYIYYTPECIILYNILALVYVQMMYNLAIIYQ